MYDYIIVGAGSAGCVLANRLTEDSAVRVLLLEAGGPDTKREIQIPMFFTRNFGTAVDWAYMTEAEPHLQNRQVYWPRGKVLGGSSSINAMIYIRGNRCDYDAWSAAGNPGWSYREVLPYFKKAENQERGASEYHGVGGPLNVCDPRCPSEVSRAFVEAAEECGFSRNADFNGASQEGFGLLQLTQKNGRRHSAADAFLRPAMRRPNLTVETNVHVCGVAFERNRAVEVNYRRDGGSTQARAEREIILCAGAVGSPQLLLLSGVGPADQLRSFAIPVVADLPGVGENLQDHLVLAVIHECKQPVGLASAESLANRLRYKVWKQGPLTSNVGEGGGFVKLSPDRPAPDLQFHFAPNSFYDRGPEPLKDHFFSFVPTLIRPYSVGAIRLRSSHPTDPPRILANYLSDQRDVDVLVEGVKLARTLVRAKAFDRFRGREVHPGPEIEGDQVLRDYTRKMAETLFHPAGSCKMGRDPAAVVDPELRVHGTEGLRVVDASVMPIVPGGNINAPTIMLAEKAADLIKRGTAANRTEHSILSAAGK
jgi:choline dehydrogenase-like flavoprotein